LKGRIELGKGSGPQGILPPPRPSPQAFALAIGGATTRLKNLWWEHRLGVSTRGVVPVAHFDSTHYATMNYSTIWSVLDHLALGPSDVFVDVGCGKGRVLCCAARYPVERVVGVDLCEPLCEVARENARRMRGRRAAISVEATVADVFDYSAATVLFLFDPFGAATLEPLLEDVGRRPSGSVRIAYANPTHDDVFLRQPWLERTEHWDARTSGLEHSVSFYRSV
jgi:SAM-dependent methyltransferase